MKTKQKKIEMPKKNLGVESLLRTREAPYA